MASVGSTTRHLYTSSQTPQVSTISQLLRPKQNGNGGKLERAVAENFARTELLGGSSFEALDVPGARRPEETPEDMQKKDPLATQVWKLYSKQKGSLPNAERMENLTWRMMALTLRRERYDYFLPSSSPTPLRFATATERHQQEYIYPESLCAIRIGNFVL